MDGRNEIKYLRLDEIIPNRLQPRTDFDEEKLNELANSIKQYGIINPILVRPVGNKYEIIAGERRYKAAQIVGLMNVPVIISNIDDNTSAELAIIENIQRQDLSSLEEAKSYRKLLDMGHLTQEQLAQKMGKNQSTIANKMRLLNLCEEVQEALENNQISERHARSLLQLKNIDDQRTVLEKIIKEKMTVKITENYIKEFLQTKTLDSNIDVIDNTLTEPNLNENIYGTDVINITELNKKEIEKDFDNMNNNELNMQMNNNIMPNIPEQSTQTMGNQTIPTPAFGDRFFPSLEDQETNINLANPFPEPTMPVEQIPQTPILDQPVPAQPMMENLFDTQIIPTQVIQQQINEPVVPNIPTFITSEQPLPPTMQQEVQIPVVNEFAQQPIINETPVNILTNPTPSYDNLTPPNMDNMFNNITAEPIINPIMQPQEPIMEKTIPVVPEAPVNINEVPFTKEVPPVTSPIPSINPQPTEVPSFTVAEQPVFEPTMPKEEPVQEPIQNEIIEVVPQNNIINAINALKNLALSIESIGYKLSINEEDSINSYKITIELEK